MLIHKRRTHNWFPATSQKNLFLDLFVKSFFHLPQYTHFHHGSQQERAPSQGSPSIQKSFGKLPNFYVHARVLLTNTNPNYRKIMNFVNTKKVWSWPKVFLKSILIMVVNILDSYFQFVTIFWWIIHRNYGNEGFVLEQPSKEGRGLRICQKGSFEGPNLSYL